MTGPLPQSRTPGQPQTVALVLTYNSRDTISACVQSLLDSDSSGLQVRVVDNASSDGTVEWLRECFPELHITVSDRNLGFAAGCNLGLEAALADGVDYVFLLNPDATVHPAMMGKLVAFMEAHPCAGAVGPRTFSTTPMPDGAERLLYAGSFLGALPLKQTVPGIGEAADADRCEAPLQVDCIWGHGLLLRTATCESVGLFDPAFFMYYEDLDLCRRMKNEGFELWCEPSALMWHDAPDGARAIESESWRWRYKARSMGIFHRKHYGALSGRCLSFCTGLLEAAQLLRQGHFRALGHQLVANATDPFRPAKRKTQPQPPIGNLSNDPTAGV